MDEPLKKLMEELGARLGDALSADTNRFTQIAMDRLTAAIKELLESKEPPLPKFAKMTAIGIVLCDAVGVCMAQMIPDSLELADETLAECLNQCLDRMKMSAEKTRKLTRGDDSSQTVN